MRDGMSGGTAQDGETQAAEPDFPGVLRAARAIAAELPPTPSWSAPALDREAGCRVVLKHEHVQPTGAFKVRGGIALLAALGDTVTGLVTASTGNHAQSIAFAAARHGLPAIVVMPDGAPEVKAEATRLLGAEVVRHGEQLEASIAFARELAQERGMRYVHPGEEAEIVHGHATVALELLRDHPGTEALYVPVGSGTGAAGACIVRDAIAPGCRVIGVQSAAAPAAHAAWSAGEPRSAPSGTRCSGLATSASCELPQRILRKRLDDFLLVDDDAIDEARRLLASRAHTLAEGAGAAALAGLLADGSRPGRCAVIVSGSNADERELASLTRAGEPRR